MTRARSFFAFLTAVILSDGAFAAIGPVADLTISNANVSPDGFSRSATVVNGQIDGPLITGKKVKSYPQCIRRLLLTIV
jgi:iron transport multicopper oxidase